MESKTCVEGPSVKLIWMKQPLANSNKKFGEKKDVVTIVENTVILQKIVTKKYLQQCTKASTTKSPMLPEELKVAIDVDIPHIGRKTAMPQETLMGSTLATIPTVNTQITTINIGLVTTIDINQIATISIG